MTIHDEILIIANKLANQGKKPSVALIKTKLSKPTPLPIIIQTLKSWQHDPEFISITQNVLPKVQKTIKTSESDDISLKIEQALLPIKTELDEIKILLHKLITTNTANKK